MAEKNKDKDIGDKVDFFPVLAKYDMDELKVYDSGLEKYMNLDVHNIFVGGVHANRVFGKAKYPIIERLINNIMRTEKYNGKKTKAYKVVREAFEIVDKKTKTNPMQVLIDAIHNSAPKEEATRLRFGGISVPKAVDVSPLRRVDIAIRNLAMATVEGSYDNKKSVEKCLADELIKASKNDLSSYAVNKKNDIERVAKSAR
ncbi:MAG: 30S ribosomal protein S7 [Candidatus Thermoplasmatota archaeon]